MREIRLTEKEHKYLLGLLDEVRDTNSCVGSKYYELERSESEVFFLALAHGKLLRAPKVGGDTWTREKEGMLQARGVRALSDGHNVA